MSIEEQLKKMLDDYSDLNKSKEELFDKTLKDIDKLEDNDHSSLLKNSLIEARNGTLNIKGFLDKIKNIQDAN